MGYGLPCVCWRFIGVCCPFVGEGQRWGFGRHLGAAVCAMVLAEDFDQVTDLAPCHLPRKDGKTELAMMRWRMESMDPYEI